MTLRAWRSSRGRLLVDCDVCSSRGHPAVAEVAVEVDPGSAEALASAHAEAQKMRAGVEGGVADAMRLHRIGRATREETAAKIRELSEKHAVAIRSLLDALPDARDGVRENLSKCPWCGAPGNATVARLVDDEAEPHEWLEKARA